MYRTSTLISYFHRAEDTEKILIPTLEGSKSRVHLSCQNRNSHLLQIYFGIRMKSMLFFSARPTYASPAPKANDDLAKEKFNKAFSKIKNGSALGVRVYAIVGRCLGRMFKFFYGSL